MIRSYLLIFLVAQFFVGCGGGYELTHNNYYLPKNVKFKLKDKFQLADTSILSTNGLYQYNCYKDRWFKFYKDGRVLLGYHSNVPKITFTNINGYAGYYTLEGNKLKIELTYIQQRNDWYILVLEGKVQGDTVLFYKDHPRGINRNIQHFTNGTYGCNYIKVNEPYFLLPPDW
jgi:hypothetical protein